MNYDGRSSSVSELKTGPRRVLKYYKNLPSDIVADKTLCDGSFVFTSSVDMTSSSNQSSTRERCGKCVASSFKRDENRPKIQTFS